MGVFEVDNQIVNGLVFDCWLVDNKILGLQSLNDSGLALGVVHCFGVYELH
jgi:hypothetical protein